MDELLGDLYPSISFQEVLFKRIGPDAVKPTRATDGSAAWDLYSCHSRIIYVDSSFVFPLGFALAIPEGYAGLVLPRSGLATKRGLTVANAPGLIDSDYRGEVMVCLRNHDFSPQEVKVGERIAQLLFIEVPTMRIMETALDLPETTRGAGGFGSTGT